MKASLPIKEHSSQVRRSRLSWVLGTTIVLAITGIGLWIVLQPGEQPTPGVTSGCSTGAQTWVSITLMTDASDMDRAIGVVSIRAKTLGFSVAVSATDTIISVDVCQPMSDTDVDWLVKWMTHSSTLSFHQVLSHLDNHGGIDPPEPNPLPAGLDPDLARKFTWRPSSEDWAAINSYDGCQSLRGMVVLDPDLLTGLACNGDKQFMYLLGPAIMDGAAAESSASDRLGPSPWVGINLTPDAISAFEVITGYLAKQASPLNELALVLDGVVITAPAVLTSETVWQLRIPSNDLSAEDAAVMEALFGTSQIQMSFEIMDIQWAR